MAIRTLRKDTNPYGRVDVSPELQATLMSNGMQAHITEDANGNFKLMTMAHNTSQPRYYNLTKDQLNSLVSGGSGVINKEAYRTFVSIVKDDYYCPQSYTSARNVNSPVRTGLHGYRMQPGEYGYGFSPFRGRQFGLFDGMFHSHGWGPGQPHMRRIGNRLFLDGGAPIVAERPDGKLKPGELMSGGYGFYDKGNQAASGKDPLKDMTVEPQKPKLNEKTAEEKQRMQLLKDVKWYNEGWATGQTINDLLNDHGLKLHENAKGKFLTVHAKGLDRDFEYKLSADQAKVLFNPKLKLQDSHGKVINKKDGNSLDERLKVINYVIATDFEGKVTPAMLNERDLVKLDLNENVKKELGITAQNQPAVQQSQGAQASDIIDIKNVREDYRSGFIDAWRSIGVVDGRALDSSQGFYLPVSGGRRVSVGEIQAYPASDGNDRGQTYKMSAVINGKVFTHEISEKDYERFLNYDDEHRLMIFDKNFKEVQMKSASNGKYQDTKYSDLLSNSDSSTSLRGKFSFLVDGEATTITSAMAWKDEVSGNYVLNVRDGKDAGMWTVKITEEQYNAFKNAPQLEKAKMLATLMPWKEEMRGKVKVVPTQLLVQSERVNEVLNGNAPKLSDKVLNEVKQIDKVKLTPVLTVKQEQEAALKQRDELEMRGEYAKPGKRLVNGENLDLDELRSQTRKNLLGEATVNGESLDNIKDSKTWKRSGEHGRATTVGDIAVDKMRDADGNVVDGKYKMSAVIDGVVVTHEINQRQFDKFLAVNDYQRMKLFDKIFPEVEMRTKEGRGFHLGAAILAALTVGTDIALSLGGPRPPRPKPEVYADVYSKPGVVSPGAVAASLYEDKAQRDMERGESLGRGMGM